MRDCISCILPSSLTESGCIPKKNDTIISLVLCIQSILGNRELWLWLRLCVEFIVGMPRRASSWSVAFHDLQETKQRMTRLHGSVASLFLSSQVNPDSRTKQLETHNRITFPCCCRLCSSLYGTALEAVNWIEPSLPLCLSRTTEIFPNCHLSWLHDE